MDSSRKSISKIKKTVKGFGYDMRKLKSFIEIFDNILGSVRESLVVLDSDLKVVRANHSFYRTFKAEPNRRAIDI